MPKLKTLPAIFVFSILSLPAHAAATLFTDLASFNSALSAASLIDNSYSFPGNNLVGDTASVTAGPATFTGQNSGYAVAGFVNDSYGISGNFYTHQLIGQDQVNTLQISFATAIKGFSFYSNVMNPPLGDPINPNNWSVAGDALATLTTSNGDALNFNSPLFSNYASDPSVIVPLSFNGVLSTTAFSSMTIVIPQGENFQITGFSVAGVPEPEAWAMMFLGLPFLGWVVRRKQTNTSIAL